MLAQQYFYNFASFVEFVIGIGDDSHLDFFLSGSLLDFLSDRIYLEVGRDFLLDLDFGFGIVL